jgi:hypothetical protein
MATLDFGQPCPDPRPNRVQIHSNGNITTYFSSAAEGKLVLKELRLMTKQLNVELKRIFVEQRSIRAQYTHYTRTRGSMLRGGGTIGRVVRVVQTISRDAERADLARQLAPLEARKENIEAMKHAITHAILDVETRLLEL